jgi:hypothetical protein
MLFTNREKFLYSFYLSFLIFLLFFLYIDEIKTSFAQTTEKRQLTDENQELKNELIFLQNQLEELKNEKFNANFKTCRDLCKSVICENR